MVAGNGLIVLAEPKARVLALFAGQAGTCLGVVLAEKQAQLSVALR